MPNSTDEDDVETENGSGDRSVLVRRTLIAAGVLALTLIAGGVAAKLILTPEKLSSMIVPRLQEAAGREVQLSSVHLKLLPTPAVRLQDVVLAAAPGFGPDPALEAEAVDLKLALLPLLTGGIEVKELDLRSPVVRYVVAEDGRHTFSGLARDEEPASEEEPGPSLRVPEFAVERGEVLYEDREAGRSARFRVAGSFSISVEGEDGGVVSSGGELRVDSLRAMLPGLRKDSLRIETFDVVYDGSLFTGADSLDFGRLRVEMDEVDVTGQGALTWAGEMPRADLRVEMEETEIEALRRLVPQLDLGTLRPRGRIGLDARLDGALDPEDLPRVEGTARLQGLTLAYSGRDDFVSDVGGELSFTRDSVRIPSLEGQLLGRDFQLRGTVSHFDSLEADLHLEGSGDLQRLRGALPEETTPGLAAELDPRGEVEFSLHITGPLRGADPPAVNGDGRIRDFAADYAGTENLVDEAGATLSFTGDTVAFRDVRGSLLGRPVEGRLNLIRGDPLRVNGSLAGEIELDRLSTLRARMAEESGEEGSPPASLSGVAVVDLAFEGRMGDPESFTFRGPVGLSEVEYGTEALASPLRIPSDTVRFTGTGVEAEGLRLRIGETELVLTATARDLPLLPGSEDIGGEGGRPAVEFRLDSPRLPLNELLPGWGDEAGPSYSEVLKAHLSDERVAGEVPDQIARDRYPVPELPDIDATGRVEVGELTSPPTRMEDLAFDVTLDRERLGVGDVEAGLYGGRLTGGVSVERSGEDRRSPIHFDVDLRGARAATFMSRWTDLQDQLTGTLDISIEGRTVFDRTLLPVTAETDAEGDFTVRDGTMEAMVPMQGVARAIGMEPARVARFHSMGGPFRVRDGELELLDWQLDSRSEASGSLAGTVAFTGDLDMLMSLSIPLSMLEGSPLMGIVQRVGDEEGGLLSRILSGVLGGAAGEDRIVDVPVSIGGTMSDPVVQVDEQAFAGAVRRMFGG